MEIYYLHRKVLFATNNFSLCQGIWSGCGGGDEAGEEAGGGKARGKQSQKYSIYIEIFYFSGSRRRRFIIFQNERPVIIVYIARSGSPTGQERTQEIIIYTKND